VAPECKTENPMMGGLDPSLDFLSYTVGVRVVGARFSKVRGKVLSLISQASGSSPTGLGRLSAGSRSTFRQGKGENC
jgi:hypothetical protein